MIWNKICSGYDSLQLSKPQSFAQLQAVETVQEKKEDGIASQKVCDSDKKEAITCCICSLSTLYIVIKFTTLCLY